MLLDVDDTIIDTRAAMHHAGAAASTTMWPEADENLRARAGERFRSDPDGHFGAFTRGELDFAGMRRARIRALGQWLGQEMPDAAIDGWQAAYEPAFESTLRAHGDALACIRAIQVAGMPLGFLTNSGGHYTQRKLDLASLAGLVEVVCTRDTLGFGKPDARAFHEACRRLGTAPRHTLYVGDELLPDALGAHDAGMPAAWLVRDGVPAAADLAVVQARGIPVIRGLEELPGLLGIGP